MKLGIISDTHGYFDPRIDSVFEGVEHILHGGDIGPPALLQRLENIAPVTAVLGNTDSPLPGIRETDFVQLAGLGFLLHHIVIPTDLTDALRERLTKTSAGIVVFGHTHKPYAETHGGVFFLNPGYTGRQRFDLPRSLVRLEIDDTSKQFRHELVWL